MTNQQRKNAEQARRTSGPKNTNKNTMMIDDDEPGIDDISLASLGAYMMFDPVDAFSMQGLNEFILKANYVFPKDQPVTIFLNSPGGDVYSGFGTIDLMECSRVKIQTVTVGIVASMAALIFSAGTKGLRVMSKNSFLMTHQFSTYFEGKYHEMIAQRGHEDDLQQRFIQHFLRHSRMDEAQIKDIILRSSDTYISAKEAMSYGLCDKIQDPWS